VIDMKSPVGNRFGCYRRGYVPNGVQKFDMHGKNAARIAECNYSSFGEYETAAAFAKGHCSEIILQPLSSEG